MKIFCVILLVCCFVMSCTPNRQNERERSMTFPLEFSGNSSGNQPLPGSPYGYEIWAARGDNNRLLWYGPNERGGAGFRAEWTFVTNFLGRIGLFWNEGKPYTEYGSLYCDFEFTRSENGSAGNYSYIGIYGWSRNPMIEYYIVEDWFWSGVVTPMTIGGGAEKMGEFFVDGETYFIYQATRPASAANIEGTITPFLQFFSVRQTCRQSGTISITEHFMEWEKLGMALGANMYEAKFIVETASGEGWFDASYISFYERDY